jgi:phosphohistidine swiveling domain-containing protein
MSKAKNLDLLKKTFLNSNIIIPKFFYFSKGNYLKSNITYVKKIFSFCKENALIMRSSSTNEDQVSYSNAGKYSSKILKKNSTFISVHSSLKNFVKQFSKSNDAIIVQQFVTNVNLSGVIFTQDINLNAPYYQINYDHSGRTDLITSGVKNDKKKQAIIYKKKITGQFKSLIDSCDILEKKLKNNRLDIEFCIKNKKTYLLQVRNLSKTKNKRISQKKYTRKKFDNFLINIEKKVTKLKTKNSTIPGKSTYFSNMADWNPAEMIGEKPNPLAISLYKELITDHIWSDQRKSYGYKDVFPNILLFSFGGSPYIDLRTDFTSFLPEKLSKKNSSIIINYYLDEFKKNSSIHDKIEFDLIETCYSFNSRRRLKKKLPKKLSQIYLNDLKILTQNIFKNNLLDIEKNKINYLDKNINNFSKKKSNYIQNIFHIVKITKDYGTLPFSGLARCAFVSQRILLDLKELDLISELEFSSFFNSLNTITSNFNNDYTKLLKKKITKNTFLNKYGHLRPSTYDINSLNYKDGYNHYFTKNYKNLYQRKSKISLFKNYNKIDKLIKKDFKISFKKFIYFAKNSIILREEAKFVFTRGINEIFENLENLGKEIGVIKSDLAFIDIKSIINFYSKLENKKLATSIKEQIAENKEEYEISKMIKLPDVIKSASDIYSFNESFNKINFITSLSLTSEFIELNKNNLSKLENKIILIKNADPGYDYIFNSKIGGLITQYGGSNSHMAIRCLELNIPAAIGVGKLHYEKIKKNKKILLDCKNKMLIPIK